MDKLMVIDGNSLAHRAFHALPPMNNAEGTPTNAIYGFLNMLFKVIQMENPTHLVIAFDTHAPTPRHEIYQDYKGGRKETDEDLRTQFPILKKLLQSMQMVVVQKDGLEADDFLGIFSRKAEQNGMEVLIVTGDRDALQLITDKTKILLTKKGISETLKMGEEELFEQYALTPAQMIELKGLMGDSSDNIPGIPGVGEKTALKLIWEYGTVENVISNSQNLKGKLREKVENNAELARMSRDIGRIVTDPNAYQELLLSDCILKQADFLNAEGMMQQLGLRSILTKLKNNGGQVAQYIAPTGTFSNFQAPDYPAKDVTEPPKRTKIKLDEPVVIHTAEQLKEIVISFEGKIVAVDWQNELSISDGKMLYLVNTKKDLISDGIDLERAEQMIGDLLHDANITKYLFDAKSWMHFDKNKQGELLKTIRFDAYIAAYLLRPTSAKYQLDTLCEEYLDDYDLEGASTNARNLFLLCEKLKAKLTENGLDLVYQSIEMPLIAVLYGMEQVGFAIDEEELKKLGVAFDEIIEPLQQEIYELAGKSFNILSPKQLGVVLFEELGLPYQKKTKTGYSTDVETMEFLSEKHPIADKVLEYRHTTKLKSTYIDGLLAAAKNSCVHSSFNQTVTATGRISSTEPNLQNIPIRTEMGRQIRRAFIASEDNMLVGADYSQIELRVLAHFSQDPTMIQAFIAGEDIHTSTAAQVASCALSEVTSQMRSAAKAVNFGIVYGISGFGLSKQLGIPRAEATEYINKYLTKYPGVKEYMQTTVEMGKQNGYVETLFGRKRFLPELRSSNHNVRSFGERVAMNAPIQGTAADIIKLAMISVHDFLIQNGMQSKLILQVHDELIIDAKLDELEVIRHQLKEIMENIISLEVPIVADVGVGKSWFDAK